jgi:hypothetical protein
MPGIIASIQTFGERINFYPHPHLLVAEKPPPANVFEQVVLMAAKPVVEYF